MVRSEINNAGAGSSTRSHLLEISFDFHKMLQVFPRPKKNNGLSIGKCVPLLGQNLVLDGLYFALNIHGSGRANGEERLANALVES